MSGGLRFRLVLDLLAVVLIVVCLAYWWLGNMAHELFGTALFALVIAHNVFNRRWYGGVAKRRLDATRIINLVTIAALAICLVIMLVTSVLISRDVVPFLALDGGFAIRELHMFAGYWVLLIIAIHLGTRWQVVMATCRSAFGFSGPSTVRTMALRIVTSIIALWGVKSTSDMAFGSKLMFSYSLDMWDFNAATSGFFVNYAAIIGLFAALTHYGLLALRAFKKAVVS